MQEPKKGINFSVGLSIGTSVFRDGTSGLTCSYEANPAACVVTAKSTRFHPNQISAIRVMMDPFRPDFPAVPLIRPMLQRPQMMKNNGIAKKPRPKPT